MTHCLPGTVTWVFSLTLSDQCLNLTHERREDFKTVMIVRFMAMVMLALLYLGGAWVQACAVTLPPTGTGNKAYSDFSGKGKEPPRLTISHRRHMPMVKPITVSPVIAADQPEYDQPVPFQILRQFSLVCSSPDFSSLCRSNRAPPQL